jgi:imidazolonepropionase-like amidohydrolase
MCTAFRLLSAVFAALLATAAAAEPILLHDVRVIDMVTTGEPRRADVLIEGEKIAAVVEPGKVLTASAREIDGKGRYLIPGLAEMHAHLPINPDQRAQALDLLALFVANGVTNIRSMLGDPWHLTLRQELASGKVIGPRLFAGAPSLNGSSAPDVETGTRLAREYAAAGYDFLKLHPGLTREVFDAIARVAHETGMPFAGHVSDAVGIEHALDSGYAAVDHLDGYLNALADEDCRRQHAAGFFAIGLVDCLDAVRIPALVKRTRSAGTWNVLTQSFLEGFAFPPASIDALRARPEMKYLPPSTAGDWIAARARFLGAQSPSKAQFKRFIDLRRQLIRALYEAGVPLLAGSDSPQIFNVPGFAAHDELEALVAAGLPPRAALEASTVNVARHFKRQGEFGAIVAGQSADLVLLEANPLERIGNTRRIAGVMLRGRWLDRAELDEMLAAVAAHQATR